MTECEYEAVNEQPSKMSFLIVHFSLHQSFNLSIDRYFNVLNYDVKTFQAFLQTQVHYDLLRIA